MTKRLLHCLRTCCSSRNCCLRSLAKYACSCNSWHLAARSESSELPSLKTRNSCSALSSLLSFSSSSSVSIVLKALRFRSRGTIMSGEQLQVQEVNFAFLYLILSHPIHYMIICQHRVWHQKSLNMMHKMNKML